MIDSMRSIEDRRPYALRERRRTEAGQSGMPATERKRPHNALVCKNARALVARAFQMDVDSLALKTRGSPRSAFARQVAMYIANVGAGLPLRDVGLHFVRDRTTVAHACALVEDLRDARDFDVTVAALESALRNSFRLPPSGYPSVSRRQQRRPLHE